MARKDPQPKKSKKTPLKRAARKVAPKAAIKKASPVDLRPAPPPVVKDIPWSYGDTRIVAMAQDPQWGFVYWEFPDEALAAARKKVADPEAGLHLRVYDTTGVTFDGLNPHQFWDIAVDRRAQSHYLDLNRPAATFHVDIGVRSGSGLFTPIARSNALELPRDSVSPDTRVEWSTVIRSGRGSGYHHRYVAPPAPPPSPPPPPEIRDGGPPDLEAVFRNLSGEGWTRVEWIENSMEGRAIRWIRWAGPMPVDLPLPLPSSFRNIEVLFSGERRVVLLPHGEQTVYGPWRVVIEALGPGGERRVIDQWAVRQRWTTEEVQVRVESAALVRRVIGGERVVLHRGGSEERLASELWGSEILQLGGSELRWRGSSELLYGGSSEYRYAGASEALFLGASETLRGNRSGEGRL